MKKTLLFLFGFFFSILTASAVGGWADCAVDLSKNGNASYLYSIGNEIWCDGEWFLNTEFNGYDFGTPSSLVLNGGKANAWTDDTPGYNSTSFILYYRVYKDGSTPGSWSQISFDQLNLKNGNNSIYEKTNAGINLLALATVPGTNVYVLEITMSKKQFCTDGNSISMIPGGQNTTYSSSVSGYKATFTKTVAAPTVAGISPTSGTTTAGTSVTITGTNLSGATAVKFGTENATITANTATSITATSPKGTAGTVHVTVTTADGTSVTGTTDQFTYVASPVIAVSGVTAGGLPAAIIDAGGDLATVTDLTVTGTIDARDFKSMRDAMPKLAILNLSGATIAAYTGAEGTSGTNATTYPANAIPQYACAGKTSLTSIAMPASATSIGEEAFYNCTGLTGSLIIPSSVTSIEYFAFSGCTGFTGSLTIPSSVTSIGEYAFYNCKNFTGSLIIPSSVTSIGQSAFQGCTGFTGSLTIPSSVTSIGDNVFRECSGLTGSVTIPSSVTSIGSYAFLGCYHLRSINANGTTPGSITLGLDVFYNIPKGSCKLVVPAASYPAYSAAAQWKDFFFINDPSPATLTAFSTTVGTASASQTVTFSVSPSMLDMTITAPTGYEIRESGTAATFGSSVVFTSATGDIPSKSIEVRIAATAAVGNLAGNLVCTSTATATQESVALSGTVLLPMPIVTGISPTSGSTVGGTTVTITGTNLTAATAVNFGSTNAPSFTVNSATQMTAVSPAGSAGAVDITVTTAGGTSATSSADQFTYIPEAQWGLVGTDGAEPSFWVSSGTLTDAMSYANGLSSGTAYIQLVSDVVTAYPLDFATGKTTILDLNGKTIDRGLTEATFFGGNVITVNGALTLKDGSTTTIASQGKITGGYNSNIGGGGIYINGGSFTMQGGNITGNRTTNESIGGGGVCVYNNSNFTMHGGSITNNEALGWGGGVYALGSFIVTGGSITGNKSQNGGVYFADALTVGGTAVIDNNQRTGSRPGECNVYINAYKTITVSASTPLTTGASIGVTTAFVPESGRPVNVTGDNSADYSSYFTSDRGCYTRNSGSGSAQVVQHAVALFPTVTSISPTSGSTVGGTTVTITGTNLTAATAVNFGSTNAPSFTVNSATQMTAVSPAGSAGAVDVTVTTAGGTSATSSSDQFTYNTPAPVFDDCHGTTVSGKPTNNLSWEANYTFAGWYTAPNGEGNQLEDSSNGEAGVTYYAKWMTGAGETLRTVRTTALDLTDIGASKLYGSTKTGDVYTNINEGWTWYAAQTTAGSNTYAANTLVLSGLTVNTTGARALLVPDQTVILLAAGTTNIIAGGDISTGDDAYAFGICGEGALTIQGSGKLSTVSGTAQQTGNINDCLSAGIFSKGNLTLGGDIDVTSIGNTATTPTTSEVDGSTSVGIYSAKQLTISGSHVVATGGDATSSAGIGASKIEITGGSIAAKNSTAGTLGVAILGVNSLSIGSIAKPAIITNATDGTTAITSSCGVIPGKKLVMSGSDAVSIRFSQPQTITFNALSTHTYGDAPFTLEATGGASGNPVEFTSSDPTVATCTGTNGATITLLKAGSCTITANQAGNTSYDAATPVSQILTVNALPVTITVNAGQTKVYGESDAAFTYTVSPELKTGDAFTGALAREAGETVGTYAINQGTLSAGTNYAVTFVGNNFTITPSSYTISGNAGIAGATLSYFDGTDKIVVAGASGDYSITVPVYWSGTVTPSLADYSFSANKVYTNVRTNLSGENYTATDIVAPTLLLTYTSDKEAVKAGDVITFTATFSDANGISESPAPTITIGNLVVNVTMNKITNLVWIYTWTVPAGIDTTVAISVTATDPAGNQVTGGLDIHSYVIDNTSPAALFTSSIGKTAVHVFDKTVIDFSEQVVPVATDLASAIIFREGGKNGIDLPFTISSGKRKNSRANVAGLKTAASDIMQLVVAATLKCNTTYYIALKAGAFADMAGNLLPLYETTFNTDPNPATPVIAGAKATLCAGDVLTCSNANASLAYIWQKDGKDIPGASVTEYTLPDNAAGAYSLKVTDNATSCASVSNVATIAEYPSVTPVVYEKKQPGVVSILVVDNTSNAFASYQWTYADGSALPSGMAAANQFLVLNPENMNAAYKVTTIDTNGCKRLSASKSVTVKSASLMVYPTVSTQRFTVNYTDAKRGNAVIRVVNTRGELIQTLSVAKNSMVETYDLNLGYVPVGVYYVELQMDGFKDTKRVIISR